MPHAPYWLNVGIEDVHISFEFARVNGPKKPDENITEMPGYYTRGDSISQIQLKSALGGHRRTEWELPNYHTIA